MFLETEGLTKNFGGLTAVLDLTMSIREGEIVGLIGPNGAGKTTVFNLITGFLTPSAGRILFRGKDISGKKPHLVAKMGIGRTFQLAYLFPGFTVFENIVTSFNLHPKSGFWEALFKTPSYRRKERYILEQAEEILHLVGLEKVKDVLGRNLPHGYQKLLTMARALAIKPKLLLLDEPIAGMNLEEVNYAMSVIKKIRSQGVTILLVEHNMRVMTLCDRVVVINFGNKIAEGSMEEVRENQEVMKAYFGREDAA
ncbi:MAG: ABC transporter ATP-binding protein [Deltaproteobacteria bacterium]|nr:ABC transporter ATP-binding protein [Deltaproteobacteria bacterium]